MEEKNQSFSFKKEMSVETFVFPIIFLAFFGIFVYYMGLANALNTLKDATIADTLPAVRKNISDFVGEADQFDDITMLGFVYKGTAE